jgi:hypothetical protein
MVILTAGNATVAAAAINAANITNVQAINSNSKLVISLIKNMSILIKMNLIISRFTTKLRKEGIKNHNYKI